MSAESKPGAKNPPKVPNPAQTELDPRANGFVADTKTHTFSAASGKFFVLANENYPEPPPADLMKEVVSASDGDLIELIRMQGGWGYGKRFQWRDDAVNEGVFCLEWVRGLKMVLDNGKKKAVEMNVTDPAYAFRQAAPADTAGKLRYKRQTKKIEDALKIWTKAHLPTPVSSKRAAKAARVASALEQEEECRASALKRKAEARRKKAASSSHHVEMPNPETNTSDKSASDSAEEDLLEAGKVQELKNVKFAIQEAVVDPPLVKGVADPKTQEPSPVRVAEPCLVKEAALKTGEPALAVEAEPKSQEKLAIPVEPSESAVNSSRMPTVGDSRSPSSASIQSTPSPASSSGRRRVKDLVWNSQWEQEAARLEAVLSSDSGTEKFGRHAHKKMPNRRFTKNLLQARRSGELEAITREWERTQQEIMSTNQMVKRSLLGASKPGELESIAEEMAGVAETKAAAVKALKERAFQAMFSMAHSKDLKKATRDMENAQKELEMKAAQLKFLMKRAFQGMRQRSLAMDHIVDDMHHGLELDRIVDEVTRSECTKERIRVALLRAHRAGQLQELRNELDEMADSVTSPLIPSIRPPPKMWADFSSDSDIEPKSRVMTGGFEDSDSDIGSMRYPRYPYRCG